jgi:hypothetical protein
MNIKHTLFFISFLLPFCSQCNAATFEVPTESYLERNDGLAQEYGKVAEHPKRCGYFRDVPFYCRPIPRNKRGEFEINDSVIAIGQRSWPAPLPTPMRDLFLPKEAHITKEESPQGRQLLINRETEIGAADFAWVPLDDVIEGARVLQDWAVLANRETKFDCSDNNCGVLVNAFGDYDGKRLEGLASCRVLRTKSAFSGPMGCFFIATFSPRRMMLAATGF